MNNTNNTPRTVGHIGWSPDYKSSATRIATRLFTNGFSDQGTRLEIKSGIDGRHSERSLGGWCFQAAVDQIEKAIIEENAKEMAPPLRGSVETGNKS